MNLFREKHTPQTESVSLRVSLAAHNLSFKSKDTTSLMSEKSSFFLKGISTMERTFLKLTFGNVSTVI